MNRHERRKLEKEARNQLALLKTERKGFEGDREAQREKLKEAEVEAREKGYSPDQVKAWLDPHREILEELETELSGIDRKIQETEKNIEVFT